MSRVAGEGPRAHETRGVSDVGKRIDSKGGVTVEDDEKRDVESQDPEGGPEDTVKPVEVGYGNCK